MKKYLLFLFTLLSLPLNSHAEVSDPLEDVNRGIFWFNDQFDTYLLVPVAKGYKSTVPRVIRKDITNFFRNIKTPIYVVSDVVQLKFDAAGRHIGRFLINTTLGGLGLADPATSFGIRHEDEDFGIALGYHGVGEGAYIVIPILGPSNLRDGLGRIVDSFLNPVFYSSQAFDNNEYVSPSLVAVDGIDTRARLLEGVDAAKDSAVDYYSFVKSTYHQIRQNQIYDGEPPEEEE